MVQKVDRASIKAQAKAQLKGKVLMTFLCIAVASIITSAAAQIPTRLTQSSASTTLSIIGWLVYIAVVIFVSIPVTVGLNKVYLNITYGYKPSVSTLFEPFSKYYKNSIVTTLYVGVLELLWYLPFLLISIILIGVAFAGTFATVGGDLANLFMYGEMYDLDASNASMILGLFCGIYLIILLLMIPYMIIINAYAQSINILCEYPNTTPTECVNLSKAMMKGRRWELFVLNLSFILWILLVCVTFGIAIIYVGPYMSVTLANYYHRIKGSVLDSNNSGNGGYDANAGYGANAGYDANAGYGGYQQGGAPYGQADQYGQPQNPQYGSNVPYSQNVAPQAPYDAPVQNAADQFSQTMDQAATQVNQAADQAAAQVDQAAADSAQALDQASHDMMTNFDDYIDKKD